jgi:type IV pilus assembly protein PilC
MEVHEMSTPIDLNSQASDLPSYLASLDDALAGRHELVDIIVAAFRSSQEPMPAVVKKQIAALKACDSSESFLSSCQLASMLPILLSFRKSDPTRFVGLLSSYVAVHTKKRMGSVRFWTYPLILTILLIAILFAQAWIVSPVFEDMFLDFDLKLPPATKFLFWINRSLREYLMLAIILIVLLIATVSVFRNLPGVFAERFQHWSTVRWLTNGTNANLIAMHHFTASLAASNDIGIPLGTALSLAGAASQRSYFEKSAASLDPSLSETASGKDSNRFPAMLQNVMQSSVGVASKVQALYCLSEVYRDRALLRKRKSLAAAQPFVIVVIGALIGFITITLFLPLISLVTSLS